MEEKMENKIEIVPNMERVRKIITKNRLYIIVFIMLLNMAFSPLHIVAKVFILTFLSVLAILKGLKLIYISNVVKNPITIDKEMKAFSYYDEFSFKRKSFNIDQMTKVAIYRKKELPSIFEIRYLEENSEKIKEENLDLDAYDEESVTYMLDHLLLINPGIEVEHKKLAP